MSRTRFGQVASVLALATAALAAHAATKGWGSDDGKIPAPVTVVTAGSSTTEATAPAAIDLGACNTLICTAPPPPPRAVGRCNVAADPMLPDLAYFATDWSHLERAAGAPPLPLGGGYANARVVRDDHGTFFGGVVERLDGGRVTDVVIAFTGANTADDFASAPAFIAGQDTPQLRRAIALYQSVLDDPRYTAAKVHVTGFSLGAGLTQFLLGYTLSRYGTEFTDTRTTFAAFGVPGWAEGASIRFGVDRAAFDGRFAGYTAENDVVHLLGRTNMGTRYALAPYTPVGTAPGVPANGVVAHTPYPYMAAFGLPDWLGDRKAEIKARVEQSQLLPTDPDYGTPGRVAMTVSGDAGRNAIDGSDLDDMLRGGGGGDRLCGGTGADRFAYAAGDDSGIAPGDMDVIGDFGDAGDVVDLSALAASIGIGAFSFVGEGPFTQTGQVRSYRDGADMIVAVNLRGDAAPEMLIRLVGVARVGADRFVLAAPRRLF